MIEASATKSPSTPSTAPHASTTAPIAHAGGVEDPANLASDVGLDRLLRARPELGARSRRLGQGAHDPDAASETLGVVSLREKAMVDDRWIPGVACAQGDRAARNRLQQVDDGTRPPAVVRFLEPGEEVEIPRALGTGVAARPDEHRGREHRPPGPARGRERPPIRCLFPDIRKPASDGEILDDVDPEATQRPNRPNATPSSTAGDPYAPADTMTRSALSRPLADSIPSARPPSSATRSTSVSETIVRFPLPRCVQVCERGVPTNCPRALIAAGASPMVASRSLMESSRGRPTQVRHRAGRDGRERSPSIRAGVDRGFGSPQEGLELGERPPVSPFVVVRTGAPDDEAGVVGGATADDPRPRGRPVGRLRLPEVGHRKRFARRACPPATVRPHGCRSRAPPRRGRRSDPGPRSAGLRARNPPCRLR